MIPLPPVQLTYSVPAEPDELVPAIEQCRPSVQRLARAMEAKLRRRDWRSHWRLTHPAEIVRRYTEESLELIRELRGPDGLPAFTRTAAAEAVDVANMALMIFDLALGCAPGDPRDEGAAPPAATPGEPPR